MAVDATGPTTTPDNIPTYNTANDIPSGKGLNAIVAAIQAALSLRINKPSSPSTGQALIWDGSAWAATTLASGAGDPVTSLPGSPVDKQQALLVDSGTAPTYAWLFQYESSIADAYKWICIGGSPLHVEVDTSDSITSTSFVDAGTVGPSITTPRAGIYILRYGGNLQANAAGPTDAYMTPKIGAAAASSGDAASMTQSGSGAGEASVSRSRRFTLAASDVIKCQYAGAQANAFSVLKRWLEMMPVRVS